MDTADLIATERAHWWTAFRFMRAAGVAEPEKFLVRLPWRESGAEYVARVRKGGGLMLAVNITGKQAHGNRRQADAG